MKKDKITLAYIVLTIIVFAVILVYFANLDFKSMNSNIEKEGDKVVNRGKHYSDKLFTMVSNEWEEYNKDGAPVLTKAQSKDASLRGKIVISKQKISKVKKTKPADKKKKNSKLSNIKKPIDKRVLNITKVNTDLNQTKAIKTASHNALEITNVKQKEIK